MRADGSVARVHELAEGKGANLCAPARHGGVWALMTDLALHRVAPDDDVVFRVDGGGEEALLGLAEETASCSSRALP